MHFTNQLRRDLRGENLTHSVYIEQYISTVRRVSRAAPRVAWSVRATHG